MALVLVLVCPNIPVIHTRNAAPNVFSIRIVPRIWLVSITNAVILAQVSAAFLLNAMSSIIRPVVVAHLAIQAIHPSIVVKCQNV